MTRFKKTIIRLAVAATALVTLANCAAPEEAKYTDKHGNPVDISIGQVDDIQPPEDYENRAKFTNSKAEENKNMIFDAKPGESISIVNPSPETIDSEEAASMITVKDAYASDASTENKPSLLLKNPQNPDKKFRLVDPSTKRPLSHIVPYGKAEIALEDPTDGGDLTIYQKEEGSPLNFDSRSPSVNELLVATAREDVEEYDPNTDLPGFLYADVIDNGDLGEKVEGSFTYNRPFNLKEGDQFYIGDHEKFDSSCTFFSFLSEEPVPGGSLIHYTVPDYSVCYHAFNVHKQDMAADFDDESSQLTMPSEEELLRELDQDGGLVDIYEDSILPNLVLNDEEIMGRLNLAKNFAFGINASLIFDRFTLSIKVNFNTKGDTFVSNWGITVSGMVKAVNNQGSEIGSAWLTGGVDIYYKKTISSYLDFSVEMLPYPKINYIMAMKSLDEYTVSFSIGLAASMKSYDLKDDIKNQKDNLASVLNDVPIVSGAPSVGPAGKKTYPINPSPQNKGGNPANDEKTYDGLKGFDRDKTGKYVGTGIVVSGPGWHWIFSYVTIEVGISFFFTPTIEGRLFVTFSKVDESILCKVAKGFDMPEGYSDDVEYSHSYWTIGTYIVLGLETGFIFEMIVYATGTKAIFNVSLAITIGLYFSIKGVAMIYWGDDVDFSAMGYFSIELGVFCRIALRPIVLEGKIFISVGGLSWKYPIFAFGTNIHFLDWAGDREEFNVMGNHYLRLSDMGILELIFFSTDSMNVFRGTFDWGYEAYFASIFVQVKLKLFDDLEIVEGDQYVTFNDDYGYFEVKDDAPPAFDFKFKISVNGWLGVACGSRTFTAHFMSSRHRAIGFDGYDKEPTEVDGVHLGGGLLEQDEVYQAPNMPDKDGTPFYGWLGDNGLLLLPGEKMTVGSESITFTPVYRVQPTYVVNFYDGYNNCVSSQKIAPGGTAVEPTPSVRDAKMGEKKFVGWDRNFDNVYSNFNVYALYAEGGKL